VSPKARRLLILVLLSFFYAPLSVAEIDPAKVPEGLRDWIPWVEAKNSDWQCAADRNARLCTWPSTLSLTLDARGGTFSQQVRVDRKDLVFLPGGDVQGSKAARSQSVWPIDVKSDSAIEVTSKGGRPAVRLARGVHQIRGRFSWGKVPEQLVIPPDTGLLEVSLRGNALVSPRVNRNGVLWLGGQETPKEEYDSLSVKVFRKLSDGIPLQVETRLQLRVAGKTREVSLGQMLLQSEQPYSIKTGLDTIFTADGTLRVKLKPGTHWITIHGVILSLPETLSPPETVTSEWPTEELWAWQQNNQFRQVEIEGVEAIESSRTELPSEWSSLPVFSVKSGTVATLEEVRRGEGYVAANNLKLFRRIFLDLDGNGFTSVDSFTGTMNQGWRLDALPEVSLGRVTVSGEDQLITTNQENNLAGVELRNQRLNVRAESRIQNRSKTLSATGWNTDVDLLSVQLSLPPGYTLLGATGVDTVSSSWLGSWTLLDFFFVLIISVATGKLIGLVFGVLAFAGLVLCHGQPGAPLFVWFHLLVALALLRVVPQENFKRIIGVYFYAVFCFTILLLIPFAVSQVKAGLYPELGAPSVSELGFDILFTVLFNPLTGGLVLLAAGISFLVLIFKRNLAKGFLVLLLGGGFFFFCVVAGSMLTSYERSGTFTERGNQLQTMVEEEMVQSSYDSLKGLAGKPAPRAAKTKSSKIQYLQQDPNAVIQTGAGVPTWTWNSWTLNWTGAVSRDETFTLRVVSPSVNLCLSIMRVVLMSVLILAFVTTPRAATLIRGLFGVSSFVLFLLLPSSVRADDFPSSELLQELEQRMKQEQCERDCLEVMQLELGANGNTLRGSASVSAIGASAWALPGPRDIFWPEKVTLNGEAASGLRTDSNGMVWVRIPKGTHTLTFEGRLSGQSAVTLRFITKPRFASVTSSDWEVDGISATGSLEDSIQLVRKISSSRATDSNENQAANQVRLPNHFIVERNLALAFPWTVTTTIRRLGDTELPATAAFNVLSGEKITSGEASVLGGIAKVTMPRGQRTVTVSSVVNEVAALEFQAPAATTRRSVTWSLYCSPAFRCEVSGTKPETTIVGNVHQYLWRLWPEEGAQVAISQPKGVRGDTLTIDKADVSFESGERILSATLSAAIRNSVQHQVKFKLSDDPEIESVKVNGSKRIPQVDGSTLSFQLEPGTHQVEVKWKDDSWQRTVVQTFPQISLGKETVNVNISAKVPDGRWIIATGGPSWGPAVLFWPKLLVLFVLAYSLGRSGLSPLRMYQWFLLILGLATLPTLAIAIPVLWILLLEHRRKKRPKRRWQFNLAQVGLVLLTLASLITLYAAVYSGLLLKPDMQVQGNGSYKSILRWYVDRAGPQLPEVWMITLPLEAYRGVMLAWSLWIVYQLLEWLKWGWNCFSSGALWWNKDTKSIPTK